MANAKQLSGMRGVFFSLGRNDEAWPYCYAYDKVK